MNQLLKNIEGQIQSCKELLVVFQNEREIYIAKNHIGLAELRKIIEKKQQLLQAFEKQQEIMKQLDELKINSEQDFNQIKKKNLVRELAAVLEQLLVIDQENERLLKVILSSSEKKAPKNVNRQRPALRPCLPFVPGSKAAGIGKPGALSRRPEEQNRPTVISDHLDSLTSPPEASQTPPPVPATGSPQPLLPGNRPIIRSRLKNYLGAKRLAQSTFS